MVRSVRVELRLTRNAVGEVLAGVIDGTMRVFYVLR